MKFNLSKTRSRTKDIVNVHWRHGKNITICAAITHNGVLHHHATLGPYNTDHITCFLDPVHDMLVQGLQNKDQARFVIIWGNCQFSSCRLGPKLVCYSSPCFCCLAASIFTISKHYWGIFSTWCWKMYDCHPCVKMTLLQSMEEACRDIDAASIQGYISNISRFFPQCLARENIACDVDEILWPDPTWRRDGA